ncbi:polymorphic toxin-type HINT domain-containing protein [Algibacter lectus]|uniref:polymorphic toxin-type HINT domain-containing protein n=1 Tax=Algibacter lectus TaxID=221126 RepID=UPI0026F04316|nr:polymorphic toxin-type HINT domain-containing protein [Algibacter lectus]MDO7135916.1 polymorphic toxin-type HINT domain-containing protein [Algibacter lectus]
MPHDLEYVVKDALMMCDKGAAPAPFTPTSNTHIKINGCLVTTKADKAPMTNIPTFGACSVKNGSPCTPAPVDWTDTYKVKVKGQETILFKSKMACSTGGKIEFITSGQVPIPPEEYDKLMEEHGEEEDGLSWWDAAELIPFIGGVIGVVRSGSKDPTDWLGVGLSVASIGLDVLGLFSFGGGNVASAAVKTGKLARLGAKVVTKGAKVGAKGAKALKLGTKGAKAFAKGAAKLVDDIAMKTGKVCVFACFTAGTKVAVKNGHKNIEDVKVGDLVWAYNEETGESDLKPVLNTMQKEIDATIELTLGEEVIETTAEHPFYTQSGWKDAADLTLEDEVKTKNGKWQRIEATNFLYTKKKVYNFEVADWHTYFVGAWEWLVHNNAKRCYALKTIASEAWYKLLMRRGRNFNLAMNLFTRKLAEMLGKSFSKEVYVKLARGGTKSGKGYVDAVIDGVGLERKATDVLRVSEKTVKAYIRDASKYAKAVTKSGEKLADKVILQVEKNADKISKEVAEYAKKYNVKIVDNLDDVMKQVEKILLK